MQIARNAKEKHVFSQALLFPFRIAETTDKCQASIRAVDQGDSLGLVCAAFDMGVYPLRTGMHSVEMWVCPSQQPRGNLAIQNSKFKMHN